jgi:hypothetical protein
MERGEAANLFHFGRGDGEREGILAALLGARELVVGQQTHLETGRHHTHATRKKRSRTKTKQPSTKRTQDHHRNPSSYTVLIGLVVVIVSSVDVGSPSSGVSAGSLVCVDDRFAAPAVGAVRHCGRCCQEGARAARHDQAGWPAGTAEACGHHEER